MQGRKRRQVSRASLLKEWCIDRVRQGAAGRSILMGKRSLLGDSPGSSGSRRQRPMGEKLTHQGKRARWKDGWAAWITTRQTCKDYVENDLCGIIRWEGCLRMNGWFGDDTHTNEPTTRDPYHNGVGKQTLTWMRRAMRRVALQIVSDQGKQLVINSSLAWLKEDCILSKWRWITQAKKKTTVAGQVNSFR